MYICPPHLYIVVTLPLEIQKYHFQQYYLQRIYERIIFSGIIKVDVFGILQKRRASSGCYTVKWHEIRRTSLAAKCKPLLIACQKLLNLVRACEQKKRKNDTRVYFGPLCTRIHIYLLLWRNKFLCGLITVIACVAMLLRRL